MKEIWLEVAPKRLDLREDYFIKLIRLLSPEVSPGVLNRLAYRALPTGWCDHPDQVRSTSVWPVAGGRPGSKR